LKKARGGRPNKLSVEDTLIMALEYFREYRTYFHIGGSYGISESYAYKLTHWVEEILIKSGKFSLPGKKALLKSDAEYEVIFVDATETPVERPKKQRNWYSGKKKRHTVKTRVVVDKKSRQIICTAFSKGKQHDFKLFKESKLAVLRETQLTTDSSYQGIAKVHEFSLLPKKKRKNQSLLKEEKIFNRMVARQCVLNEQVIGCVKRFRILSERYRNRCKRFGLRFSLIAAIYNFSLG
jgi:hypothetical protein